MNWAAKVKQREQKYRTELLAGMNLKEEQMAEMIFEGAYTYLEKVFGTDAYGTENLPRIPEFWNWWRMEWAKIDSIFYHAVEPCPHDDYYKDALCLIRDRDNVNVKRIVRSREQLLDEYIYYHEATMKNRYINNEVITAGMHHLIDNVINKDRNPVNHG